MLKRFDNKNPAIPALFAIKHSKNKARSKQCAANIVWAPVKIEMSRKEKNIDRSASSGVTSSCSHRFSSLSSFTFREKNTLLTRLDSRTTSCWKAFFLLFLQFYSLPLQPYSFLSLSLSLSLSRFALIASLNRRSFRYCISLDLRFIVADIWRTGAVSISDSIYGIFRSAFGRETRILSFYFFPAVIHWENIEY
mgnify:CR=1 FL=1